MATNDKPKARRKGAMSEKTREKILDAAVKLFLAKGFEKTSTADIVASAKLTKPTLYYYFTSKNHLLASVHLRAIERNLKPYIEKVKSIEDPVLRLHAMLREFTTVICTDPALRFLLHGTLTIKDKYSKDIKQVWKDHYLLLRNTIGELQSDGRFDDSVNASRTALLLLGMITWVTFWYDYSRGLSKKNLLRDEDVLDRKKAQIDEIADLVEKIAFDGLARKA
jgi:TetR/AcrR family transcriptional regulator, cholesterol catabolism regulator